MQAADLAPFLGRRCQVMVQCAACGRTHTHEGALMATQQPGELSVDGRTYQYTQVRALVLAPVDGEAPAVAVSRPFVVVVIWAGVALALLSAVRLFGG